MKHYAVLMLMMLIFACGEKPGTDPAINIPGDEILDIATPDLTVGIDLAEQNVCRANMQTAAASIAMVRAQTGSLPQTLGEALSIPVSCPDGGSYTYTVEGDSWKLECPADPSHGCIEDGGASW